MGWTESNCIINLYPYVNGTGDIVINSNSTCKPPTEQYNKGMPGIEFMNNNPKFSTKYNELYAKELTPDNHFTTEQGYCFCRENNVDKHMIDTLYMDLNDNKWDIEHGHEEVKITFNIKNATITKSQKKTSYILFIIVKINAIKYFTQQWFSSEKEQTDYINTLKGNLTMNMRLSLSDNEKMKIKQDAIVALGHKTYKIHIQPKPEYQYWVLDHIFKTLIDYDLIECVRAVKVLITYDQVKYDRIPVVVIYPFNGKGVSKKVLNMMIKVFSKYSDLVGINILPRWNHKYDSLIYWANGNGDDKQFLKDKNLSDIYFDKTPGCLDDWCNYTHWKCPGNSCHIQPDE
jgi:ribosome-associated toxin RatA of RatAB toxin-antitoxin module